MKTNKFLYVSALCSLLSFAFVACDNDDDPKGPEAPATVEGSGVYLMNSGKSKSNNATLDYYDFESKELTTKVFSSINGRGLGDTANDILVYGSKMYIAVSNSNMIEVTDLHAKSLKSISPKDDVGQPQSPRYLYPYQGKVYVTLFDGHLAEIDTTAMEITKQTKVGPNPYNICEVGGKLYVANSGGYNPVQDSTLSVIDPVTFVEEKKVVVGLNPTYVAADSQGDLYVTCAGNFADVKASVRRVDLKAGTSTELYTNSNITATLQDDKLYVIHSENDENWLPVNTQFVSYDAKADKELSKNFITDGTVVDRPYYICVSPYNGDIYITNSDYKTTGDVFIFSAEGKKIAQLEVSGLNPMGVGFLK